MRYINSLLLTYLLTYLEILTLMFHVLILAIPVKFIKLPTLTANSVTSAYL